MTMNIAGAEFDLMNYINTMPPTRPRLKDYQTFFSRTSLPDIIAFQEAFDVDGILKDLVPYFQHQGYWVALTGKRKKKSPFRGCKFLSLPGMTAGLMMVSRYPILRWAFKSYDNCVGVDSWANKGCLVLECSLEPDKSIIVVNTHLQGGFEGLSAPARVEARRKQFLELQEFLGDFAEGSLQTMGGIFVLGDFNTGRFHMPSQAVNWTQPSFDYSSLTSSLCEVNRHPNSYRFKDLMIPVRRETFAEFFSTVNSYDKDSPHAMETGVVRGTNFNSAAVSYVFFMEIVRSRIREQWPTLSEEEISTNIRDVVEGYSISNEELERDIRECLHILQATMYIKSQVTDHILMAQLHGSDRRTLTRWWKETHYAYQTLIPLGHSGILSDHAAVIVNVAPRSTSS
jgi:hypothetical protein